MKCVSVCFCFSKDASLLFFFFSCRLRVPLRVLGEKIGADHADGKSTRCFSACFTVWKTAKAPVLIKLTFYYGRKVKTNE